MINKTFIPEARGLDSITVYWDDFGEGRGSVTITCYGQAWTCYFGAMGSDIQDFFRRADVGYLCTKLGITPLLKQTRAHQKYLQKIISAIKLHQISTDIKTPPDTPSSTGKE